MTAIHGSRRRRLVPRPALVLSAAAALVLVTLLSHVAGRSTPLAEGPRRVVRAQVVNADPCPDSPANLDLHGKTFVNCNFSGWNLGGVDFSGSHLQNAAFIRANLTSARFDGATIESNAGDASLFSNFTFAVLTGASFRGATFIEPVYFTYATMTCTDFSNTDLTTGIIFGDSPLAFDRTACRPKFQATTMNCEFIAQWPELDLTDALIGACTGLLTSSKRDFSGAKLAGIDLSRAVLDGWSFSGADLSRARLDNASLRGADFSQATLFGTSLNNANLDGANLYHAFLANDTGGNITGSASLRQAHLKNVNLSSAQLSGVDLTFANFYGDNPAGEGPCETKQPNHQGFTNGCATANNAVMDGTKFDNAYLFGVDFTGAKGLGVSFSQAILTGANLSGAAFAANPVTGNRTTFFRAQLQGANLAGSTLDAVDLTEAFVDFRSGGNIIYLLLNGANHNSFAACPTTSDPADPRPPCGQDVCVVVMYPTSTTVPSGGIVCPDGSAAPCGPPAGDGSNPHWATVLNLASPPPGVPPGWYLQDATYQKVPADSAAVCAGKGSSAAVFQW